MPTRQKIIILCLIMLLMSACTYSNYPKVIHIPARITPADTEKQKYINGVCYLTDEQDSVSVNFALDAFDYNSQTELTRVSVANKSASAVRIAPETFYFALYDSSGNSPLTKNFFAYNAETELGKAKYQLQTLTPPAEPSKPGSLILDILDLFSKDTPQKRKDKANREEQEAREWADLQNEYLRAMTKYQDTRFRLQQTITELENSFLKTNDLDAKQQVGGKVRFPSPLNFFTQGKIRFVIPVNGRDFDFWFDFIPARNIYPDSIKAQTDQPAEIKIERTKYQRPVMEKP